MQIAVRETGEELNTTTGRPPQQRQRTGEGLRFRLAFGLDPVRAGIDFDALRIDEFPGKKIRNGELVDAQVRVARPFPQQRRYHLRGGQDALVEAIAGHRSAARQIVVRDLLQQQLAAAWQQDGSACHPNQVTTGEIGRRKTQRGMVAGPLAPEPVRRTDLDDVLLGPLRRRRSRDLHYCGEHRPGVTRRRPGRLG
ncbi:hypothetical protein [Micromonospora sonneratiae]|uniref:Uncharacterized protein n=1 Tax=Micromonospora sonneratiae TaxID=1184706 RepID=A0ABW3YNU2_9ACTN